MVNLSPRLPIKQQASGIIETTEVLIDVTRQERNNGKTSKKRDRLVTEKPDFEIIDDDYLL